MDNKLLKIPPMKSSVRIAPMTHLPVPHRPNGWWRFWQWVFFGWIYGDDVKIKTAVPVQDDRKPGL